MFYYKEKGKVGVLKYGEKECLCNKDITRELFLSIFVSKTKNITCIQAKEPVHPTAFPSDIVKQLFPARDLCPVTVIVIRFCPVVHEVFESKNPVFGESEIGSGGNARIQYGYGNALSRGAGQCGVKKHGESSPSVWGYTALV